MGFSFGGVRASGFPGCGFRLGGLQASVVYRFCMFPLIKPCRLRGRRWAFGLEDFRFTVGFRFRGLWASGLRASDFPGAARVSRGCGLQVF